jgi:phospholipase/lecithinase/hemolysin
MMANPLGFSRAVLVGAMLFVAAVSSSGAAGFDRAFSALYVFGDSLSDPGNAYVLLGGNTAVAPYDPVPSAPYDTRRFTNGRTWAEILADDLRLPRGGLPAFVSGVFGNYAVGGAQAAGGSSPDFESQVSLFLQRQRAHAKRQRAHVPSDALYVVQFGGNDIRAALELAQQQGNPYSEIQAAIDGVVANIEKLHGSGARQFLVANAPNIGRTPAIAALGSDAVNLATGLSVAYNEALDSALDAVADLPDIEIYRVDFFAFLDAAAAMPDGFGFADDVPLQPEPCLPVFDPAGAVCDDPDQRLFWDGLHPTRAAHRIVGTVAFNILPANRDEQP